MQFIKNSDQTMVTAYFIGVASLTSDGNYSITLPEASKIVGLYQNQTAEYTPTTGDAYIDNGNINDSIVVPLSDFNTQYTQV